MKIYFDGCSHTWGAELAEPEVSRYSRLVSDHFGAEEYNISRRGGSDKRVFRNLLEADLTEYDFVILQLTCTARTEFWCDTSKRWMQIKNPVRVLKDGRVKVRMNTYLDEDKKFFWKNYWKHIYTEKLGQINQLTLYHAMKNLLKDKKHLIIGISSRGQIIQTPVDINFTNFKSKNTIKYKTAPAGHPSEEGHKQIAEEIIKCISI
tara:strand:- start:1885 stop:2502 length:618 start_codon:yes stop_codon:yes gene_type:complete